MQGKTRGFLEDTGILLVLAGSVYGGYYFYTEFFSHPEDKFVPSKTIKLKEVKKDLILETNTTVNKASVVSITKKEIVVKELEKKEKKAPLEVKKLKKIVPIEEKKLEKEQKKKNTRPMLRTFLRELKSKIASTIVNIDDKSVAQSKNLKIRVTLLSDGSYEQLTFVSGNKKLFENNKKNILKIFPVEMKEEIKKYFPRYVRVTIK